MNSTISISYIQSDLIWENPKENRSLFGVQIMNSSFSSDIIILPELFTTGFTMHPQQFAETMDGKTINWMKIIAKSKDIAIVGSLIIVENDKYYNRLIFVEPNGNIATYDKRHLFTYGGEDKVYTSGKKRLIIEYKGWKFCPMICYDLRFPVWSRNCDNYDVLLYIANWPKPRTTAWNTLLKARSIENMCYTIGVNRIGVDGNKLLYSGNSQAINMLGEQLIFSNDKKGIFTGLLDKQQLLKARNKFQFLNDKDSFVLHK